MSAATNLTAIGSLWPNMTAVIRIIRPLFEGYRVKHWPQGPSLLFAELEKPPTFIGRRKPDSSAGEDLAVRCRFRPANRALQAPQYAFGRREETFGAV